jgi:hypothetical protein
MGRLTLNVLLSFAQFEREVTSERIRDKIAASKRKGLWVGGMAPLGYDTKDRKITVNDAEADRVRTIFRSYLRLGSLNVLMADLRKQGIVTKVRTLKTGQTVGGIPFTRGPLAYLLRNRFYLGEVAFKGETLAGEQPAIVDRDLFDAVQGKMNEQINNHRVSRTKSEALLLGRIYDDHGHRMTPSHVENRHQVPVLHLVRPAAGAKETFRNRQPGSRQTKSSSCRAISRGHLGRSTDIADAVLIRDHVVRSRVQSDQLVIELAKAKSADRKRKHSRSIIRGALAQDTINPTSRNSPAQIGPPQTSARSVPESRTPGRIDCTGAPLAGRAHHRPHCEYRKHRRT